MFVGLLVLSVLAYAFQGVLIGQLARRHDLLWVSTVRGLALIPLMAPLLLLAAPGSFARIADHGPALALACVAAMCANLCQTYAMRHLPMAIANALSQGSSALGTLALAAWYLNERPGRGELACVGGILVGVGVLSWLSSRGQPRSPEARPLRGIVAGLCFGGCMATALIPLGMISREVSPYVAAWAWEGGIGLAGAAMIAGRWLVGGGLHAPGWRIAGRIGLVSTPTIIGTGAYTAATTMGPLAVAGGVLSTMMVATALFARAMHGERLRRSQWLTIAAVCAVLIALGLVRAG